MFCLFFQINLNALLGLWLWLYRPVFDYFAILLHEEFH
jgi:hypothetical protein